MQEINKNMNQANPLVSIRNISKSFGSVRANHDISLEIRAGKIKALLGENGAGKSTLMSILSGRLQPDFGEIYVDGNLAKLRSPKDAHTAGIGMVYQHFMLVDSMTVTENILLGNELGLLLKPSRMRKTVRELSEQYGLIINPDAYVGSLSMGERQRVEILKLLSRESRILIFDEPTAVLTPVEGKQLFIAMRRIVDLGKAIVFISHKLPEVLEISDEIAILRRGEIVDEFMRDKVPNEQELARRMLGHELLKGDDAKIHSSASAVSSLGIKTESSHDDAQAKEKDLVNEKIVMGELPISYFGKKPGYAGRIGAVLDLRNVSCQGLKSASFSVVKNQVLALVGVAGNGQKELVEIICGNRRDYAGDLRILSMRGADYYKKPLDRGGVVYIPEDRQGMASCPELNLVDNFLLTTNKLFSKYGILQRKRARKITEALIYDYTIRPGHADAKGRELSGGNLQKLIVGRELLRDPRCIVAENPTQGLDVAATEEVWQRLRVAKESSGILLVTGDINEALSLADHIAVIYQGSIIDIFAVDDKEKLSDIGMMMAGSIEPRVLPHV